MFDIVLIKEGKNEELQHVKYGAQEKLWDLKIRFKELLSVNNHLHVKIDLNND